MINYAGSISQLANNEMQMDLAQRAALERMLARLIDQHNNTQRNALQARQLDQHDAAQREQARQFGVTSAASADRENRLSRQFDTEVGLRRDELDQRRAERDDNRDWQRKVFTMNEADKKVREMMPYAEDMAQQGMFGSTEDVLQHFPSLAGQAPAIAARSKAARAQLQGQLEADQSDADLLNEGPEQAKRYQNMVAAEKQASWNGDNNYWWRPNKPDANAIDEWTQGASDINGAVNTIHSDRRRMERLQPDASGKYRPAAVLPWMANRPAAPSAAVAPNAAPAPAPSAPRPDADAVLQEAQRAIQAGKDPAAVRQRLIQMGIQPNF